MNLLDVILGKEPSLNDAEESLGKPDHMEADNLSYHVEKCATRWVLSYRMSRTNNAQIAQVRLFVVALLVLEAARTAGLTDWLKIFIH
jgi:hypothetical protein